MNRRDFLKTSAIAAGLTLPAWSRAATPDPVHQPAFAPTPDNGWRVFELSSRIEPSATDGITRVWVPLPSVSDAEWIRPMGNQWQGNAQQMRVLTDPVYGASMLSAEWAAGTAAPVVEVVSRFATRDRAVDLSRPGPVRQLAADERTLYTRATVLLPTDGIVRDTASEIVRGATSDVDKARAIYEWIVANTFRNPKTRGCGLGDIRTMLETGDLSGKCADLNALYVGLARSVGVPARDVYGVRVADSRYGYKSLGKSGDVSKAQHCRAEVWLERFGWVPVDPADVRKVALEEPPGQLSMLDPKVAAARQVLFGAWEMNWVAYNVGHDLRLPGSDGPEVPYLMYPQGENRDGRFDSLDPAKFRYTLTAREITAA
ncbi:transglutaminase-like domain-containing protein [Aromatoleum diolicum]|uniref:Twin-arginine translocation signal domain-containing protein n=1 Tax=Aromatoleum diolicum TaxID=75796 RepID=A0ABX1QBB3_9RHOO|nr:transglutaminase domain-containing protein [Aromatoleum diolicum]NMG75679.1 twin-arginine translocation signal domain-containing protein [Aromatoleum diolicum]